jgi:hypothetical protein
MQTSLGQQLGNLVYCCEELQNNASAQDVHIAAQDVHIAAQDARNAAQDDRNAALIAAQDDRNAAQDAHVALLKIAEFLRRPINYLGRRLFSLNQTQNLSYTDFFQECLYDPDFLRAHSAALRDALAANHLALTVNEFLLVWDFMSRRQDVVHQLPSRAEALGLLSHVPMELRTAVQKAINTV